MFAKILYVLKHTDSNKARNASLFVFYFAEIMIMIFHPNQLAFLFGFLAEYTKMANFTVRDIVVFSRNTDVHELL